jgi:hypothetical protein
MAFYNRINDFYILVGNSVDSKTNQTIDTFLNSLPNKYSNAGLILNFIKNSGVSGNTKISVILSNSQYYNILNEALKLAKITDKTDFYQGVLDAYSKYTQQNKVLLVENDLTFFYSGDTFCYTNLTEVGESYVSEDVPVFSGDVVTKNYKLSGSVFLGETDGTNTYVIPLGLLSLNGDYDLVSFGNNKNGVSASDTLFINVSTPLTNGCLVTDLDSGDVVPADVAFVIADNSLITPNDYVLFLIVGNSSVVNGVGLTSIVLDQEILITNVNPNLKVTFTNF